MLPDRVSNPGPLTYESGVLPIFEKGTYSRTSVARALMARFPRLFRIHS